MLSKFIKYIRDIVHNFYNNDIYNNPEQKEHIQTNLSTMYNGFINNNINKKLHHNILIEINNIMREEMNFYCTHRHKQIMYEDNYIELLFQDFMDLWRRSIDINNLFETILNKIYIRCDYSESITDGYKITNLFKYHWNKIILNKTYTRIVNNIVSVIYKQEVLEIPDKIEPDQSLDNILYIIKTHFIEKYNDLYNILIEYGINYHKDRYDKLLASSIDIYDYIEKYKISIQTEVFIGLKYTLFRSGPKRDIEPIIVNTYFKSNKSTDFITRLYIKALDHLECDKLKVIDKYLLNNLDIGVYKHLKELFVDSIINKHTNTCAFDNYIDVYTECKQIYSIQTFKNYIEEIINQKFIFIRDIVNVEEQLLLRILDDHKKDIFSDYFKLLIYVNKELFMVHYIKYLCKRIINKKYKIDTEYDYYKKMIGYELEDIYKVEIILGDIVVNKTIVPLLEIYDCITDIMVVRKEIWPIKIKENIPNSFVSEYRKIKAIYETTFENKKLFINTDLLRCDIVFNGYTLNVKGYMVDILLMFNENDTIKKESIKMNIQKFIQKFIKIGLVKDCGEFYHINDSFNFPRKHIKIN